MGFLRFILAISVVLAHSSSIYGFGLVGGKTAVQAFYIISGFYMTLILNEKYIGTNNSYKLFITNRFLRLYPIYWIILLLTVLFSIGVFMYSKDIYFSGFSMYVNYFDQMSLSSFLFLIFINLFIFFQDIVMFLGLNTTTGHLFLTANFLETNPLLYQFLFVPQAWTIGVEIVFYLIAPFLVRRKLKLIIYLLILSVILRILLSHYGFKNDPWTFRFFPTELAFFLMGIIAYHSYRKLIQINIQTLYLKMIWGFVLVMTCLYGYVQFHFKGYIYLVVFCIGLPFIFILSKNWKIDKYIGELSFPIYISHIFIFMIMTYFNMPILGSLGLGLLLLTILFSMLLNEFVAKKIENIRQKRVKSSLN
jgi:peptidoglycan/LPS O-acetylase OafA/YrhL